MRCAIGTRSGSISIVCSSLLFRCSNTQWPDAAATKLHRNNKLEHTIEIDPERVPIAQRMFALYASGQHSLNACGRC